MPANDGIGYTTLVGATDTGRTVSVAVFSRTADEAGTDAEDRALKQLMGNALC